MSRNPGIGHGVIDKLVSFHETPAGRQVYKDTLDVQGVIRYGARVRPLGRYLVRKTRERLNIPHSDPNRPSHIADLPTEARYLREQIREVTALRAKQMTRKSKL